MNVTVTQVDGTISNFDGMAGIVMVTAGAASFQTMLEGIDVRLFQDTLRNIDMSLWIQRLQAQQAAQPRSRIAVPQADVRLNGPALRVAKPE